MRTGRFLLSLSILTLSGCTGVVVPNARVCAVAGVMSAGADCAYTLDDKTESMTLDELITFLEPGDEHGAAIIMSALDFSRIKTALEQACTKLKGCTPEVKKQIEKVSARYEGLQARVANKKRRKS